jgi:hypothetical protein
MSINAKNFDLRDTRRFVWVVLALASMLSSAYCFFGWMSVVGRASGWTGLPQYAPQIPQLETQASVWAALAIALPFMAALLLTVSKRTPEGLPRGHAPTAITYRNESATEIRLAPGLRYLGQLAVSLLGTIGFVLVLFLLGFLLQKLTTRSG